MEPGHPCLSSFILPRVIARYLFIGITLFGAVLGIASCPAFAQGPVITTVAGGFNPSASPAQNACVPIRAAAFLQGNAYVMSCNRVFKVDARGNWTLIAGTGMFGFGGDGGPATSAMISEPRSVGVDAVGNVYILDEANNRLREVFASSGMIQTIAGTGTAGYTGDGGLATDAEIAPGNRGAIFVDASTGDIYLADDGNNVIRKITAATGIIATVAGNGSLCKPAGSACGDGGPATSAKLRPLGVFADGMGDIFIADGGDARVREVVAATGNIQTIAGTGTAGFSGDGGPATSAELNEPDGVFVDPSGNVFVSDQGNERIREIVGGVGGNIKTLAGNGTRFPSTCSTSLDICVGNGGPATSAIVYSPQSVTIDQGNLFIVDLVFGIQEIPSGSTNIENFAGNGAIGISGDGGLATNAQLDYPLGAAVDAGGNIYIADTNFDDTTGAVREVVASTGLIKTVAGNGTTQGLTGDGGPAANATTSPNGIFVDSSANIFIADAFNEVREISAATGEISSVAGNGTAGYSGDNGPATSAELSSPSSVFLDALGNIFIADAGNSVIREVVGGPGGNIVTVAGNGTAGYRGDNGPATSAELNFPSGVWVDASQNIFVADTDNNVIREVVGGAGGNILTVAGNGTAGFSGDAGLATAAEMDNPYSIFGDGHGNLFVTDFFNNAIREFSVGGNIQTVVGNEIQGLEGDGGPATNAEIDTPNGVFVTPAGSVLFADSFNGRIRLVGSQATPPTVWIDAPESGAIASGLVTVSGWAVDNAAAVGTVIANVQVLVDGTPVGTATYGSSRPDVCAVYTGRPGCPNVGFYYSLNTSSLSVGTHMITVAATDSDAVPLTGSYTITVNVQATPPTVWIDAPSSGAAVSGIVNVSGWAIDNAAAVGTAINNVQVKVDGNVVGTAAYGSSRPDVCTVYSGRPGCPNVGFSYSLNTSALSVGAHTITVTATDSDGTPDSGSATVNVNVQATPPAVWIDAPTSGAVVSGIVTVSGWAVDNAAAVGTAINNVQVKVDGNVVGAATYGSSRPDVCMAYPGRPGCPNVGYSYSLNTSTLSVGSHTITVTATDSDGSPDSGSMSVNVNVQATPPTVWIDAPTSGAAISGIVTISGWAIDNAATVGTAISSVQIKVDGTLVGSATYGISRPDVCAAYPGRPGCPNVGYSYSLDTSTLSAGAHTITVTATDSDGTPDSGSASVGVTK